MAKATFKMPVDFINKLSKLNNKFDDIVPRVLQEGAEPAIKKAKQSSPWHWSGNKGTIPVNGRATSLS